MRFIKRLLMLLIALAVVLLGVMFTIHNTTRVSIDLVLVTLPEASLSLWLIGAFALGAILGLIFSSFVIMSLKTRLYAVNKRISASQRELEKSRLSSSKDLA
ncbi:LapA family protein [Nitrincola alkalilacustris]|uniref:LapA family protein n=1 Tax=Nitrincola alkalilacustris TaxID=1571224 RepID=UPI001F11206A|nr:LapA family protein [Nitrincola alkalilacustris]